MRRCCVIRLTCLAACGRESTRTMPDSVAVSALRDTLVRKGVEDQAGRDSVTLAIASNDTAFLGRLARGDSVRSRWLQQVVAERGWPRRSVFGDEAAGAAWLIVQHSPMIEFQEAMLPVLETEERRGEVRPPDVAMLSDRIRMHRHQPQRYGTQFSLKGDKLVADSILDLTKLDSLRAAVGLPPMTEYVNVLAEMYRMPVEWPPSSGKMVRR
jgi:hypothetical protein